LRDSIAHIRKRGYQFISLDEAMRDEVYSQPDTFAGSGQPPLPPWVQELMKQ
jgi:hypothetical protein